MSSKIQKSPCSEAKFPCSRARQRKPGKPQAAQAGIDREDALFEAGEFGDLNPVALQRTMWWFLSLNTSFSEQENISQAIRYCLPSLQFLQVQT